MCEWSLQFTICDGITTVNATASRAAQVVVSPAHGETVSGRGDMSSGGGMSALNAENIMNPDISTRDKMVAWMANQGVSTVLLLAIFWGVYAKGETIVTRIEAGYSRNAADLARTAEQQSVSIEKLIAQWKDDRRLLIELLRGKEPKDNESTAILERADAALN